MYIFTVDVPLASSNKEFESFELCGCTWQIGKVSASTSGSTTFIRCEPSNAREGWSCDVHLAWSHYNSRRGDSHHANSKRTFCEAQRQHEVLLCDCSVTSPSTNGTSLTFIAQYFDGFRYRFQGKVSTFAEPSKFSDLVLQIDDRRFHVNKTLLCLHSPVFEKMLCGQFAESGQKEIVIKDVDPDSFTDFLKILYNHQFHISDLNVTALLELYDRFDVSCVAQRCEEFLRTPHTEFSLAEKFLLADKFNLDGLAFDCCYEVSKNRDNCRTQLEKSSSFSALSNSMQNDIFKALFNWQSS